jgi:predicted dehydrogenase
MTRTIGIGVIGMGWMGGVHSRAYRQVHDRFAEIGVLPRLICCADSVVERAKEGQIRHEFERYTTDWRTMLDNPDISVISVTTPNDSHKEIVCAAVAAGKHVHCEKPVGKSPGETAAIYAAVEHAGVVSFVGFNYRWAPMVQYARRILSEGKLGQITHVRSRYFEGYARNPAMPFSWRFSSETAGTGVLNDQLSHTTDLVHFLIGPIEEVVASRETWIKNRTDGGSSNVKQVTNEDYIGGLFRFANGARGSFEACRIITGPQQELKIEVNGTQGSLIWDFERMNELQVHYNRDHDPIREGYTRLFSNPDYPFHDRFNGGQGTGLGYEDLKTIEVSQFLASVLNGEQAAPSIEDALAVARVHDAISRSWDSRTWEEVRPL